MRILGIKPEDVPTTYGKTFAPEKPPTLKLPRNLTKPPQGIMAPPKLKSPLEGQIVGAWISELGGACERMLTAGRKVTLDLGDVSLIDRSGLTLLVSLSRRAVALVRCSPFQEAQLRLASSPQPDTTH
jgi:ABC-type transporter Mla MlaB component